MINILNEMGKDYYDSLAYYQYAYYPALNSLSSFVTFPKSSVDHVLLIVGTLLLSCTPIHAHFEICSKVIKSILADNSNIYAYTSIY